MLIRCLYALFPLATLALLISCGGPSGLPNALGDCPGDSSVTWSDVEPTFEASCTSCHSVDKSGTERVGAKEAVDYDNADLALNSSGTTPQGTWYQIYARTMPPGSDSVRDPDALLIHEWLSCGGPE